jgi:hypothetical protein
MSHNFIWTLSQRYFVPQRPREPRWFQTYLSSEQAGPLGSLNNKEVVEGTGSKQTNPSPLIRAVDTFSRETFAPVGLMNATVFHHTVQLDSHSHMSRCAVFSTHSTGGTRVVMVQSAWRF